MKPFEVFQKFELDIVSANGCYVYDNIGTEYLDMYCGHAVISVGHTHPYYVQKIEEQLKKIAFYSNTVINTLQTELAYKLGVLSGYTDYSVFFANSGAEANENALKLASFYNRRKKILSFVGAFHGRTAAAAMTTDIQGIRAPINSEENVFFAQMEDITKIKKELNTMAYSAVIIEGIQGVAGINIPSNEFLFELSHLCQETGTLLILDEVQPGYGRTGQFFAHQYANIKPDLITVAKGIGNGFPMSGTLINPKFKAQIGMLGSTFGGNHLACAAAIAVLDIIDRENLIENAANIGKYLMDTLKTFPQIDSVRGRGLMIGIEFNQPITQLRDKLLYHKKIFTGVSGSNIIRLLPPLCLSISQVNVFLSRFEECLSNK
ncbi:MAG: aminotransferase class III-fold pyridoxal phosphate-dependent enzyme [Prolixibacteraceae bacterium]